MRRSIASAVIAILVTGGSMLMAQHQSHVISTPQEAQWGPAPPFIPAGAQIAVLAGDPTKPAPYAVRLKFPANYTIAPHSHPTDENVVVTSGSFTIGMGDTLSKTSGKTMPVGGYARMPANMNHFAYTTSETTIILYGVGPVEFKYVNPSDDPRNAKTSK
jgi:quercetin dioxygenase-like cupin family protein